MTRLAISPLFAIRILVNEGCFVLSISFSATCALCNNLQDVE